MAVWSCVLFNDVTAYLV